MPYVSNAQRKKFHVLEQQGKISPETVKEWDEASKGKKLPEHVGKKAFWTGFCEKCAEHRISPLVVQTVYSQFGANNTACQYNGSNRDSIVNTFAQALGRNK